MQFLTMKRSLSRRPELERWTGLENSLFFPLMKMPVRSQSQGIKAHGDAQENLVIIYGLFAVSEAPEDGRK